MSESSTRCLSSASSPHLLSPRRKALSSKAIVLLNQGRLAEARILLEAAAARAHAEQLYASALRAENKLTAVLVDQRCCGATTSRAGARADRARGRASRRARCP